MNPCPRCGQLHPRCQAHRSGDGQPCGRWPTRGGTVCGTHGARAPQVREAAALRLAEERARHAVARVLAQDDIAAVRNFTAELAQVAGALRAASTAAGHRVNDLADIVAVDAAGKAYLRPEVGLWERLVSQYREVLAAGARLGLDERLVALQEQQARTIVSVLNGAMDDAGLTGALRSEVEAALVVRLRAVSVAEQQ